MDKKKNDIIRQETEIPKEVIDKLVQNRENILNNPIKQEKKKFNIKFKKQLIITLAIAASLVLIALINPQTNTAIKNTLGISTDSGVVTVEEHGIQTELNLTSTYNNREITVTKFVSTKKRFAFDYQFKLDDEKLKELLEKQQSPDRKFTKFATNFQDLDIGLFVDGQTDDIRGGGMYNSTFHVEGDTFYGSVTATLNQEDIPSNAKLTLHIYKLMWQDAEELDQAFTEASKTNSPFGVDNALTYEGDWRFDIAYKPLTQTAETQFSNLSNITNPTASSDALQTTVKFITPLKNDVYPAALLYKDGVRTENQILTQLFNYETGEMALTLSISALDTSYVYTVQVNEIDDFTGEPIEEIGHFDIQNKKVPYPHSETK